MAGPARPIDLITHDQYLDAWGYTVNQFNAWYDQTDLGIVYSTSAINPRDHGCPPPPPWLGQDDHTTGYDIDGKLALWCEGARFDLYQASGYRDASHLDRPIPHGTCIDVACMGTMFWFLLSVQLRLREVGLLPEHLFGPAQFSRFKYLTATDMQRGFADAAVELGLGSQVYTDPNMIAPGDPIGVVKANGDIGHWCFAGYDGHRVMYDGGECIRTYGASPWAEGVGFDPYRVTTTKGRRWVGVKLYRK